MAITGDGEKADLQYYLDEDIVKEEAGYDGIYAVCTEFTG